MMVSKRAQRGSLAKAASLLALCVCAAGASAPSLPYSTGSCESYQGSVGRRLSVANMLTTSLRLRGGGDVVHPTLFWSQREKTLSFKIDVPAGTSTIEGLAVEEGRITWKTDDIQLNVQLFKSIKSSDARIVFDGGRQVAIHVEKTENGWWPRLTVATGKVSNVKVDWASWKDEDEVDEQVADGEGGPAGDADFNFNAEDMAKRDAPDWAAGADDADKGDDEPMEEIVTQKGGGEGMED